VLVIFRADTPTLAYFFCLLVIFGTPADVAAIPGKSVDVTGKVLARGRGFSYFFLARVLLETSNIHFSALGEDREQSWANGARSTGHGTSLPVRPDLDSSSNKRRISPKIAEAYESCSVSDVPLAVCGANGQTLARPAVRSEALQRRLHVQSGAALRATGRSPGPRLAEVPLVGRLHGHGPRARLLASASLVPPGAFGR